MELLVFDSDTNVCKQNSNLPNLMQQGQLRIDRATRLSWEMKLLVFDSDSGHVRVNSNLCNKR